MSNLPAKLERASKFFARGELVRAQALCREILVKDPALLQALILGGVIAGRTKDFPRAVRLFDRAIAVDAGNPMAHCNRGLALQELHRNEEALDSYDTAIRLKPDYAVAYFNRGLVLQELDRTDAALLSLQQAIAINPSFTAAHYNRGVLLHQLKDWRAALACYDRTIALQNDHADAYNNRGVVLRELGQLEAALRSYDRAIELDLRNALAYLNRGVVLERLAQSAAALASYDQAIAIKPLYLEAYFNRGLLLTKSSSWDVALSSFNHAIQIDPGYAEGYLGRGILLSTLSQIDDAVADFDRAITIKPDLAQAHLNRAFALLRRGEFDAGWIEHEWRWRSEGSSSSREKREFAQPLWLGKESLQGKTLFIYSEQGLGDTLQFCRYAKLVAELGATIILEVQRPLRELLTTLEGVSLLIAKGDPPPAFDFQCPLMSLPLALKTTLQTIPAAVKYVRVDGTRVESLEAKLGGSAVRRIGLAWSGSATHPNDHHRSIPLAALIGYLPGGFQYFCLQKELRDADREVLRMHPEIQVLPSELDNFVDTAVLCECMDLVISADTSIAHLSAALGRNTWILLSSIADWRWLLQRADSPWYPTVTLYRQEKMGDWTHALEQVHAALLARR